MENDSSSVKIQSSQPDADADVNFCLSSAKIATPSVELDVHGLKSDEITTVLIPNSDKSEISIKNDDKTSPFVGSAECCVDNIEENLPTVCYSDVEDSNAHFDIQRDDTVIISLSTGSDNARFLPEGTNGSNTNVDQDKNIHVSIPEKSSENATSHEIVTVLIPEINTRNCPSGKGKKRMSYDLETKLEAVHHAELYSKRAAARKYGVDTKRIREWCCYKAEIACKVEAKCGKTRKRLGGGGRKVFVPEEIENALADWFKETRAKGERLKRKEISQKAEAMWNEMKKTMQSNGGITQEAETFKASDGWVTSFMRRQGLSF